MKPFRAGTLFFILMVLSLPAFAAAPEHYYNPPENVNPDPAFTPGPYAAPEVHSARTIYENQKQALAAAEDLASPDALFTLNAGEVSFTAVKNEKATVLGYFRNFSGMLKLKDGVPASMTMVIDVNSLDTAVPGRNNRVLDLFFQSAKPELGTIFASFDQIELAGKTLKEIGDGLEHAVTASGKIKLNGVEKPLAAALTVQKKGAVWSVQSAQPFEVLISDFGFEERVPALLKACNHKALGNAVKVKVDLYLK